MRTLRYELSRTARYFDRGLRTVKEYLETVEYIPMNPVRRGLVKRAEEWKGSSIRDDAGVGADEPGSRCGLEIDCLRLPPNENTRI